VESASKIRNADGWGAGVSDPFVKVSIDNTLVGQTKTIKDDLNPVWNEKFAVHLDGSYNQLVLEVFDQDVMSSESLGTVTLKASELTSGKSTSVTKAIDDIKSKDRNGGQLTFSFSFSSGASSCSSSSSSSDSGHSQRGLVWNGGGKKKALLIGINYLTLAVGKGRLNGCANDVANMKKIIVNNFGFPEANIRCLIDEGETNPANLPTHQNILNSIKWLVGDAVSGDSLFFHFSGHGSQVPDKDNDEEDGKDETIIPMDFRTAGQIIDDVLFKELVKPVPKGARLTSFMDCCHSGTGLDLPFTYESNGAMVKSKSGVSVGNHVVLISGCLDDQTSADAKLGGMSSGAMTYAFVRTVNEHDTHTELAYCKLLAVMREKLATAPQKFTQVPQLSSSSPLEINENFGF